MGYFSNRKANREADDLKSYEALERRHFEARIAAGKQCKTFLRSFGFQYFSSLNEVMFCTLDDDQFAILHWAMLQEVKDLKAKVRELENRPD